MSARRVAVALAIAACALMPACGSGESSEADTNRSIDQQLAPASTPAARDGLAAAILIDVSGSMDGLVAGDAARERKIDIAKRAARDLVDQFARYAAEHPDEPVLLGLYEFSERQGQPDCRTIIAMSKPDVTRAEAAVAKMVPDGGTPIGSAMITAKRELDATGLSLRHLLVITDGENTAGFAPEHVTAAIGRRPEAERPSIYFVAFDIAENRFAAVRDAGGLVLAAANARELNDTLDALLRGKILVEK